MGRRLEAADHLRGLGWIAGVVAVINLAAEEPASVLPRDMIYCRFPIMDGLQSGRGFLDAAIQTLVSLLNGGIPPLGSL